MRGLRLVRAASILAGLGAVAGCRGSSSGTSAGPPPPESAAVVEAHALIDQGKPDAALQRLEGAPADADALYEQGRAWAKKAETAPPPSSGSGTPSGAGPPPLEFKSEEQRAVQLFEKAIAARADHAGAHRALATLLAPHAVRRADLEKRPSPSPSRHRGAHATPPPPVLPDSAGIDVSAGRVIREYQLALPGDPSSAAVEALIAFSARVGRLDAAESGYRELLQRVRERAEPFVRYGDFLMAEKKDVEGAIEQYRQALIWKADDEATRQKLIDIYITRGADYYSRQQYAIADSQFREAEKYVTDRNSEAAQKVQSYQARLREIRR